MYVPYPSKMKKKPESKDPMSNPDMPPITDMTEIEADAVRRANYLMSPYNLQEAQKLRSRRKFIRYLLLSIAAVIIIIWALTR